MTRRPAATKTEEYVPNTTPTILRWRLGQQMRELREQAGITVRAAAKEIESSQATMSKIESGKQAARPLYIKLLTAMYGVEPALRSLHEAFELERPDDLETSSAFSGSTPGAAAS